jgi:hypothetical protein
MKPNKANGPLEGPQGIGTSEILHIYMSDHKVTTQKYNTSGYKYYFTIRKNNNSQKPE